MIDPGKPTQNGTIERSHGEDQRKLECGLRMVRHTWVLQDLLMKQEMEQEKVKIPIPAVALQDD